MLRLIGIIQKNETTSALSAPSLNAEKRENWFLLYILDRDRNERVIQWETTEAYDIQKRIVSDCRETSKKSQKNI